MAHFIEFHKLLLNISNVTMLSRSNYTRMWHIAHINCRSILKLQCTLQKIKLVWMLHWHANRVCASYGIFWQWPILVNYYFDRMHCVCGQKSTDICNLTNRTPCHLGITKFNQTNSYFHESHWMCASVIRSSNWDSKRLELISSIQFSLVKLVSGFNAINNTSLRPTGKNVEWVYLCIVWSSLRFCFHFHQKCNF